MSAICNHINGETGPPAAFSAPEAFPHQCLPEIRLKLNAQM